MKVINKDFKFNDGKEHCRVFCKGFKKDISRDEITKIFETIGTIVDIRLPETREVSLPFGDEKKQGKIGSELGCDQIWTVMGPNGANLNSLSCTSYNLY